MDGETYWNTAMFLFGLAAGTIYGAIIAVLSAPPRK